MRQVMRLQVCLDLVPSHPFGELIGNASWWDSLPPDCIALKLLSACCLVASLTSWYLIQIAFWCLGFKCQLPVIAAELFWPNKKKIPWKRKIKNVTDKDLPLLCCFLPTASMSSRLLAVTSLLYFISSKTPTNSLKFRSAGIWKTASFWNEYVGESTGDNGGEGKREERTPTIAFGEESSRDLR